MNLDELRNYPRALAPVSLVSTVTGLPMSTLYDALRNDTFPIKAFRVGKRLLVPVAPLISLLEGQSNESEEA